MKGLDKITPVINACLSNAEHLLNVARVARGPEQNHIAYHLAALALEEVGKASMLGIDSLRRSPLNKTEGPDDEERRPADWIEDHERKLFWALFTPMFGRQPNAVEQIRQFQSMARRIHEVRLATLYVNPSDLTAQQRVSDQDVDTLLSLTEARLGMEKLIEVRQLDDSKQQLVEWFFAAVDDPQLKTMVLNGPSLAKLAEFDGDSFKWIAWLRDTIDEMYRANQALAEKELQRTEPEKQEENDPKWKIKIRLRSWSHSIRPKSLAEWNGKLDWIRLFTTKDKKEMLVQFTLPKRMPIQAVWSGGMQVCSDFVLALNIATVGYFWWYLPTFVSRYYEEIVDIENNAPLLLERNPRLVVSWGHLVLKTPQLSNVFAVFAHLAHITTDQRRAYDRYFRALSFLAKNDIFSQFEATIMVEFYEAFRAGLAGYGDWDGVASTFETAAEKILSEIFGNSEISANMKQISRLALELLSHAPPSKPVTLDEVIKMKISCDVYFMTRATQELQRRAEGAPKASAG